MHVQRQIWLGVWLLLPLWAVSGSAALAESEPTDNRTVVEQIEGTAKKVGNKIEQGFSKAAKKIEEKHIVDKVERKLKKAATKTAEGFKKAGEKIDQKVR
jgi:methionine-rich copper-binding protein CopC